jgi:hypothetical protein
VVALSNAVLQLTIVHAATNLFGNAGEPSIARMGGPYTQSSPPRSDRGMIPIACLSGYER